MRTSIFAILTAAVLLSNVGSAAQQAAPLPLGKVEAGVATAQKATVYEFKAATAGLLSVAIQGDGDIALVVVDEDGQSIPEGTSDRDLHGSSGAEQVMVTLTEPGTYRVQVRLLDGQGKYQIGAAWIPFPARARPSDPDKRPGTARPVEPGTSYEDSLDAATGDAWDWYVFTPKTSGTLTVVLRPVGESQVDLQLDVYATADFSRSTVRSDQDMQDNPANESATLDVKAGQKIYVKVTTLNGAGKYRVSSSLIQ